MDALAFHAYPQRNTHPPSRKYAWPNASAADLARIKQAVWDAFNGTAQPTFPEVPQKTGAGTLGLVIGEFGWQVDIGPALEARYNGKENVPTVTEAVQADYYAEVIGTFACDPAVTDALLLHLVDDPDLGRFQTGLLRLDGSERPSYAAVQKAIAAARNCNAEAKWSHATGVVGAKAIFGARDHPATKAIFGISTRAQEEAAARACSVAGPRRSPGATRSRSLARATRHSGAVLTTTKLVKAGHKPRLSLVSAESRVLRLRPAADRVDEPQQVADVRQQGLSHRQGPSKVQCAYAMDFRRMTFTVPEPVLTRTRVRSTMANTCSRRRSSSHSSLRSPSPSRRARRTVRTREPLRREALRHAVVDRHLALRGRSARGGVGHPGAQ